MADQWPEDTGRLAARCETILREIGLPFQGGYGADYFLHQARAVLIEELRSNNPQTWEDLHRLIYERLRTPDGRSDGCFNLISAIGPTRRGTLPT